MISLVRVNSSHPDFIGLIKMLDADLAIRDGEEHAFYAQFNTVDSIRYVVLAYNDVQVVGCGAIKAFDDHSMEVKRMFVLPEGRNMGIASRILSELEKWTLELSCVRCVLETGKKQHEAIALYKKCGYRIILNYGQYIGKENSVCFEKLLSD